MSDLQISLLIIGAVVVGGVYLFNWIQERKFRRKLGQAFESEREDVLLEAAQPPGARVEPQVSWSDAPPAAPDAEEDQPEVRPAAPARGPAAAPPPFDPDTDYVAVIEGAAPIPETAIDEVLDRVAACGKPCRVATLGVDGNWVEHRFELPPEALPPGRVTAQVEAAGGARFALDHVLLVPRTAPTLASRAR